MAERDTTRDQDRLDDIQDDIDHQRDELADDMEGDTPRFIREGEADGPVDDTIAPPG